MHGDLCFKIFSYFCSCNRRNAMHTLISIIISCFSIGIILSAPMGPVGILCIQRSLSKGRRSGFYTGVGAALSDLCYCLLIGLGMSIVMNFIEGNQHILQIGGSVFLMAYAIYLLMHNPDNHINAPTERKNNISQDMITGYAFTLSNPLIIFLIIPLFARFGFPPANVPVYESFLGYLFILLGAISWWTLISYFVSKVRDHFNIQSMRMINRIIGAIIMLLAIFGLVGGLYEITAV